MFEYVHVFFLIICFNEFDLSTETGVRILASAMNLLIFITR